MSALILDTETTGLTEPRPVEIAWVRLSDIGDGLMVRESFSERYDPDKAIEYGAMATHHIIDKDVAGCPPWTDFRLPDGVEYLIGHKADYDWAVIGSPAVKRICTLALARHIWPTFDSHSLGALLYAVAPGYAQKERGKGAHGAEVDVAHCHIILAELLLSLNLRGEPVGSWDALWQASEVARVPVVMPYGKHKGLEIATVPADYKRWLLGQPDVDPYLRTALAGAL